MLKRVERAARGSDWRERLALANGRRAELEIADAGQLVAIVCALECAT